MSKKLTEPTVKKSKRHLRCKFNNEELLVIGTELAESNNALAALENDKASIVSEFAAKIKAAEATVSIAAHKISSGYEFRDVPVTIRMHQPVVGKKVIFRDDTNELVATEDMTQEELQPELPEVGADNPLP